MKSKICSVTMGVVGCFSMLLFTQNVIAASAVQQIQPDFQNTEKTILNENIAMDALDEANELLNSKQPQRAMDVLQPAIQYFEKYQNSQFDRIYAANGTAETLLYLMLGTNEQNNIRVFSGCWAELYFTEAYAFIEMNDMQNAQIKLKHALALSPFNSEFLKELGFIQQVGQQWQASVESFKMAEAYLYLIGIKEKRLSIQQGVRRSLGVSLIELNRLEEATQYFKKVLNVDPSDQKARNELKYIEELKNDHEVKKSIGRV
ncbi:hypothetical protein [Acinetobacter sp.]|jgi:tetratricopeptide (TPR) repeat protein|uniref:hypothetical protein n=1 Tax=Acinetobacter sp. TaxID=472 RepID=UPI003342A908